MYQILILLAQLKIRVNLLTIDIFHKLDDRQKSTIPSAHTHLTGSI